MTDIGHLHQGQRWDRTGKRCSHPPIWYTPEPHEEYAPKTGLIEWADASRFEGNSLTS
jgi:hypothetical protein